jgi:TRAP transporter 4TM/12TM fusion protein
MSDSPPGNGSPDVPDALISPVVRVLRPILAVTLTAGGLAWSADLYRAVGLTLYAPQVTAPIMGIALALVYLHFPARRNTERTNLPWYDGLAAAVGFATGWYVSFTFPTMINELIFAPYDSVIVGTIFYILCIEGLRRTTGYALLSIVLLFSVYAMIGHLIPGDMETREVSLPRLISYLGLDTNALMGFILKVAATIVFTFVFFGQLLMRSGGSGFFNDIALALMGRYRGGSAKIAITASSLFGSVSGIVVSNIVATGVVTIPMMKRNGFPARLAAAVEACASTGGQLMPPVMGSVAFIMADFLARPYREIVIAAVVPSFLYYVALFIQADLEAARRGIARVDASVIPSLMTVMKTGWIFIIPFAALIYALFWLNWQVQTAAVAACVLTLIAGFLLGYQGKRMTLRDIYESFFETGISVLEIMMIVGGASFIIGILFVTGLGSAFTLLLVKVGGDSLLLLLIMTGVVCIILGMGMPTLAVYVLLAAVIAPSLVEVGISPLAAHMFILYLGMMSFLTPPVAIAAFFAANLAQAPPMATGWTAMRFGWTAYVIPFLFVFSPALLLQNDNILVTVITIATAAFGVWMVSAGMIGFFVRPMNLAVRGGFLLSGVLLTIPSEIGIWAAWTDVGGAVAGGGLVWFEIMARRQIETDTKLRQIQ